jgi:glucose 1-dehydrogenase
VGGRLEGKRALVTGAERGIGRAIALGMAREGADVVVLFYRQPGSAEEVVTAVRELGRRALAMRSDVSRPDDVRRVVDAAYRELGGLEVLVNNAGILLRQPFLEIPEADFTRILEVNLKGTFLVSQEVARRMVAAGAGGSIVNISSLSAERAAPGLVHYQASKAGVFMLTRGMALELARYGIRVNAIAPGLTLTDLNRDQMTDPVIRAQRIGAVPLGRPGTPDDHVGAAIFLASDESAWMTGASIAVDGGLTIK